ncbi:hypothetical protein ACFL2V_10935 [Pseudomonadota bacterium]
MKIKGLMWTLILLSVLPVFASAGTFIKDVRVWGAAEIDDFIGPYDNFNVELVVNIDGDTEITLDQVELGDYGINPASCAPVTDGFKCIYQGSSGSGFLSGGYSMSIYLFDDAHVLVSNIEHSYTVDGSGPSIDILTDIAYIGTEEIDINIDIEDKAFSGSIKCAGIKKVIAYLNDNPVQEVDYTSKACTLSETINITPSGDQNQKICFEAYDWLDNLGDYECLDAKVDITPPEIVPDSLEFVFEYDFQYIGLQQDYIADFKFEIIEANFDPNGLNLDLSELNSNVPNYQILNVDCDSIEDNLYECTVPDVSLFLQSENPNIVFDLTDLAGNNLLTTMPFQFTVDKNGPEALEMTINGAVEQPMYLGLANNSVTVKFKEEESAMIFNQVFLEVFTAGNKVQSSYCEETEEESIFECKWLNLVVDQEGEGAISVSPETTDAFNNPVTNTLSTNVIVDATPPVVTNFSLEQPEALFPVNDTFFECIPIIMKAYVNEENPKVTVKLLPPSLMETEEQRQLTPQEVAPEDEEPEDDPGNQITGDSIIAVVEEPEDNETDELTEEEVTQECVPVEEGKFYCEYVIPCIPAGDYQAEFVFEDAGKNKDIVTYDFEVWAVLDHATDMYDVLGTEMMPSAYDRSTAPFLNHRILVLTLLGLKDTQVTYVEGGNQFPNTGTSELIRVFFDSCEGDTEYVGNITVVDGSTLGEFPYIEVILKKMEMPRRELKLACTLNLYTLISSGETKSVNRIPEVETVEIEIPFFETVLPKEMIDKKVESITNKGLVANGKFISDLQSVLSYLQTGCNIYNTLITLDQGLALTCTGLGLIGWIDNPACHAETVTSNMVGSELGKGLLTFCDFVTCKETLWGGQLKQNIEDWWMGGNLTVTNMTALYGRTDIENWMNPKDSLIGSLAFGCIPGVIDKAQEMRNIECGYAVCVEEMSTAGMMTAITYCDQMHSYSWCKYVGGEISYIVPPVNILKELGTVVKEVFSDPVKFVLGVVTGSPCGLIKTQPLHAWCITGEGFLKILNGVSDIFQWISGDKELYVPPINYCERYDNA